MGMGIHQAQKLSASDRRDKVLYNYRQQGRAARELGMKVKARIWRLEQENVQPRLHSKILSQKQTK